MNYIEYADVYCYYSVNPRNTYYINCTVIEVATKLT